MKPHVAVELLAKGESFERNAAGHSMEPIVMDKERVRVSPIVDDLKVGDIVFCKVNGNFTYHKITKIKRTTKGYLYQISNNKGHVNGWTNRQHIYGIVSKLDN